MLTTQSYLVAIAIYGLAAVTGVATLRKLWFATPLTSKGAALLGLISGTLVTPAFPDSEVATVAPALIVVTFNFLFGDGIESVLAPSLWLLGGAAAGLLLGLYWRHWRLRPDG